MRSLERYKNAEGWRNFQHIEGIDTGDEHNLPGDVNHDETVDIDDVTALISMILGVGEGCNICGDVDGDNSLSIDDVTTLISIVLGNN